MTIRKHVQRVCARNSHSYTRLILALGIVRKSTVWGFIIVIIFLYAHLDDNGWAACANPAVRCAAMEQVQRGAVAAIHYPKQDKKYNVRPTPVHRKANVMYARIF